MAKVRINERYVSESVKRQSEILDAVAQAIKERAVIACPVDTGALAASIRVEGDGLLTNVSSGTVALSMSIGSDLPYANVVEYGTSRRRAQPFLRPALDSIATTPPPLPHESRH